jgi:hypothetical protein
MQHVWNCHDSYASTSQGVGVGYKRSGRQTRLEHGAWSMEHGACRVAEGLGSPSQRQGDSLSGPSGFLSLVAMFLS